MSRLDDPPERCRSSACMLVEILPDRWEQPWAMADLGVDLHSGLSAPRRSNRWDVLGRRLGYDAGNFGVGVKAAFVGNRRRDAADAHSGDRSAQHEPHDLSPRCRWI